MSLSGWRPTSVRSLSSRNRLPAFGPRRTTSMAVPAGSVSSIAASATGSSPTSGSPTSMPTAEITAGGYAKPSPPPPPHGAEPAGGDKGGGLPQALPGATAHRRERVAAVRAVASPFGILLTAPDAVHA